MGIILNSQQVDATDESEIWWKKQYKQTFEISGPAGSGKTTIVHYLIDRIGLNPDEVLFMAYVGKATMALARQGNNAQTIHSTIYNLVDQPKLDEDGNIVKKNGRIVTVLKFEKKPCLPSNIKLLVIDEGSMVNKAIAEDILSFGLPVLILGDLNQLPPVFGDPYFLVNPDVILTQIMRQKENDPIIYLSQLAIKGKRFEIGKYGPKCYVIDKESISDNLLVKSDIVICGKNKTRDNINRYVRRNIMGIDKDFPLKGEKLICRQNNWKLCLDDNIYLINGLIGYVENIYLDTYNKRSLCIDFRPEFMPDKYFEKIPIDYEFLFESYENKVNKRSFYNKFEFANAITCHLSQGSQYNKVLVYDEKMGDRTYYNKWRYTAVTRAIEGLVIAV
jgi:ATP-dependent exoDNAse (exonuclease V) alpha subunit